MILIVTSKRDGHIGAVAEHLDQANAPWIRINTEDFATNVEIDFHPASGKGALFIKDSAKRVILEDIRVVWYRKPEPIILQHFQMDLEALDYVEAEFNEILHGLYALLDRAYWINNPFSTRIAHRKLLQLRTAAEVGFVTPKTLVTNRHLSALDFSRKIDGDLAIKSLGAISIMHEEAGQVRQYGIFTRRITIDDIIENADKISHMPTLFQEFVEKQSELRITCVGDEIFACEIRPRANDVTHDDYRFDTPNLPHMAVDRPDLKDRMHAYMQKLNLNFGCFDFLVPQHGAPIFLEMNCNGQWLWVQERTGQQIGKAIANYLIQHSTLGTVLVAA